MGLTAIQKIGLLVVLLVLSACSYHGPDALSMTRPEYNVVIQRTNEQELLLNLVRLKYRDTPYFLSVEKVASSVEFSRGMSASALLPAGGANSGSLSGTVMFSEKPTVFYSPLDGEKFVRKMMTPLSLDMLVLLINSGWSVERVLAVTLHEINGIKNAPTASGPTPLREPEFREFRAALKHLRVLQVRKLVELGQLPEGAGASMELRFVPGAENDEDVRAFKRILKLNPQANRYKIVPGIGGVGGGDIITFATRSLIASMNYLSQGVEAPPADMEAGRVTRTLDQNNLPFDWQDLLSGIFRVHSSQIEPDNAAVGVGYRNAWFWIQDNDLDTKATFSLLSQLLALQGSHTPVQGTNINYSISR
uniref:Uncharacterized protein n=1 Tax=Candidatus Nitrotoga fabula TaxID=2182327 RepID=A0A2X0SE21_9PROT|nr:conserved protein of unknown function [Candidatus Nitrotoga fabula]